tara:strand:+ start:592 stop:852 length:261 start_codon:yes stop_codon:yes gene_type:complete
MDYLIILGLLIGIIVDFVLAFIDKGKQRTIKTKNYNIRIHHCTLGVISMIIGIFYNPQLFVSFGIGIILSHTIRTKEFKIIEIKKR